MGQFSESNYKVFSRDIIQWHFWFSSRPTNCDIEPASFWIGGTLYTSSDEIDNSTASQRIVHRLERKSGPVEKIPTIIVYACLSAKTETGGDKLMSSLAKKMNATVFASASLNYAFRPGEIVNS